MFELIGIFLLSLGASLFTIRSIIIVARLKKLYDSPTEDRKIHLYKIPNLGGIGIYCAFTFSIALLLNTQTVPYLTSMIAASILIFAVGLKDDLVMVAPSKKFLAQILAALIMAYFGNIRITSFYGILGIYELSYPVSFLVTILFSVYIYNAINLIDGVDGLAGGIGLLASGTYAVLFWILGYQADALVALAFAGSILGFLFFNVTPAKTFMGDSGSLITGFVLSILSFKFAAISQSPKVYFTAAPTLAIAILLIPLFDTLRVFILRIMNGKSPFEADSNHIHHRLLNIGFTHLQTTGILLGTNIIIIALAILFQPIGNSQLLLFLFILAILNNVFLWNLSRKKGENATIKFIKNINEFRNEMFNQ